MTTDPLTCVFARRLETRARRLRRWAWLLGEPWAIYQAALCDARAAALRAARNR